MEKYLYGFNVFGIQAFIGSTSKLKEIVGASELVEAVCKKLVPELVEGMGAAMDQIDVHQAAAGHFRCVIKDEQLAKALIKRLPMEAEKKAPGIGIAQALVKIAGTLTKENLDDLEAKLRTQRNKIANPAFSNLMIMQNSRRSGLAAVYDASKGNDYLDLSAYAKEKAKGDLLSKAMPEEWRNQGLEMCKDFSDIAKEGEWLAVVHIDGNDLGLNLVKLWEKWEKSTEIEAKLQVFSNELEQSTVYAFRQAAVEVFGESASDILRSKDQSKSKLPFRVLVLGGDDLTLVCSAKDALKLSTAFIEAFEKESQKINGLSDSLTACGGIAYIKPHYPFYYGLHMAEALCKKSKEASRSKKAAGEATPSTLLFHKIQDSYAEDFEALMEKEYHIVKGKKTFMAGPYSLSYEGFTKVDVLLNLAEQVSGIRGLKNDLRKWLSMEHLGNQTMAQEELIRRLDRKLLLKDSDLSEQMHLENPFSKAYHFSSEKKNEEMQACEYQDLLTLISFL